MTNTRQQRARAAQRLANAEQKLNRLGWHGRRAHGGELRAEIAMQRVALRLTDEKLAARLSPCCTSNVRQSRALERERGFGIER